MTSLKTLAQKVKLTNVYGAKVVPDDDWHRSATSWRCTLRYKGRRYTFDFFQGSAISREPDVEGVLDCLLSDAQAGEQSFDDFCSELGYDSDSRKAEATHKACEKVTREMKRLLGDDYETFLYADRN